LSRYALFCRRQKCHAISVFRYFDFIAIIVLFCLRHADAATPPFTQHTGLPVTPLLFFEPFSSGFLAAARLRFYVDYCLLFAIRRSFAAMPMPMSFRYAIYAITPLLPPRR
jgi:hypothetical protein